MSNIFDRLVDEAKKKKKQFENTVVDTFSANTTADRQKRVARGLPADYRASQKVAPNTVRQIVPETIRSIPKVARATGLAAQRSAVDIGQAGSGFYDLASKGTGTNRFSKKLDQTAKNIDATAKREGINPAYRIMQAPMSLATFAAPGGALKAVAKTSSAAKVIRPAQKAVAPINRVVNKGANKLAAKGAGGRILSTGIKQSATIPMAANAAVGTGYDLGLESGKGRDISRKDALISAGANTALPFAMGAGGQAAIEGVRKTAPTVIKGAQKFEKARGAAVDRQAVDSGAKQLKRQLEAERVRVQGQINSLPPTPKNAATVNSLLIKQDRIDGQLKNIQGATRTRTQAVTDKVLTANPGLTVGGIGARDFQARKARGEVFDGVDGKPRFEIDDSGAVVKPEAFQPYPGSPVQYARMGDLLDHPELYKNYPDMADIDVAATPALSGRQNGKTRGTNDIEINPELLKDPVKLREKLLHEGQHSVQNREQFARGDSPSKDRPGEYWNSAGEAEARAVEARADLPMSKRYVSEEPKQEVPIADFAKTDRTSWDEAVSNVGRGELSRSTGPVEVVKTKNGYMLIEGNHRAVQALNEGKTSIPARVLSKEDADEIIKRDGPHMKNAFRDAYTRDQLKSDTPDTKSLKREIAELDRKINAFEGDSPARQKLIDRQIRAVEELEGGKQSTPEFKDKSEFIQHLTKGKAEGNPTVKTMLDDLTAKAKDMVAKGANPRTVENRLIHDAYLKATLKPEKYATVDEFIKAQGTPLYHGTDAQFDRFSLGNFGKTDEGFSGKGVYLTARKGNAKQYGKNVVESYANLKNPLEYEDSYSFGAFSPDRLRQHLGLPSNASAEAVTAELKRRGHDGLVIHEQTGKGVRKSEEVVVLDPEQIMTKQQLTDLYNDTPAPSPTKRSTFYDSLDVPKDELIVRNGDGVAMSIDDPKSRAKKIDEQLKALSDSPEMQEFYKGGNISGKTWNEYQRLSKEYRQALDEAGKPTATPEPTGNDLMAHFSDMRKQMGNDEDFYNKVILPNVESEGMIGQLSRSIAREVEGKGNDITGELDWQLKADDPSTVKAETTQATLTDLKRSARQLEKDTGQTGLYKNLAVAMKDMNAEEQIEYLSKGLTDARDSGVQAAAFVNKQTGYQQKQAAPQLPNGTAPSTTPAPVSPDAAVPVQPPVARDTGAVSSLPDSTKPSRLANRTIQKSDEVSPELKQMVKDEKVQYTPTTNEGRLQQAEQSLAGKSDEDNFSSVLAGLKKGVADEAGQNKVTAIAFAKKLDEAGDEDSLFKATEIYHELSQRLSEAGQEVQAAALLASRTPQGLRYKAQKDLREALGDKFTKDIQDELNRRMADVKKAKPGTEADNIARDNLQYFVASKMPTATGDKIVNFWRAGLLTAPTTTGGAAVGNAAMTLGRKLWINPGAAITDTLLSLKTGQRSYTLAKGGEWGKGAKRGAKNATGKQFWKTGYDPMNPMANAETMGNSSRTINYGDGRLGRATGKYVNGVYKLMGAADQPFRYGAYNEVLSSLAKADAKNLKLKGAQAKQHIDNFINDPPDWAKEQTMDEAMGATFQNKTALATLIQSTKQGLRQKGYNKTAALVDFFVPFSGVPSAVADRAVRHSGIKAAIEVSKALLNARKGEKLTLAQQRDLARYISEGTIGLPVVAAGYALAAAGQFTGGYPTDNKERELWRAEGKQENSVKIGNRWYSLNYVQPFGVLMALGAGMQQTEGENGENPLLDDYLKNGGMAAIQSFMGQSYLEGLQGPLEAFNDPEQNLERYIASATSSFVPNFVRSAARAGDSVERDTKGVIAGVKGAVPGLRGSLPERQDMFGQSVPNKDNFANMYANPLKPSRERGDATTAELRRLFENDEGILPTQATKNSLKGVKLDDKQMREIDALAGTAMKQKYAELIATPEYQSLGDEDRRKALDKVNDAVYGALKNKYAAEKQIGPYAQGGTGAKLTKDQKGYLQDGSVSALTSASIAKDVTPDNRKLLAEYDTLSAEERKAKAYTENDYDYKVAVAKLENDMKSGKLSKTQQVKRKNEIDKALVGKTYSKDTRDLYSLNKGDIYDLITNDKDGQKLADELLAYDQELYDKGLVSSLKFKYGFGTASKGGSGRSGGGRKTGGWTGTGLKPSDFKTPYDNLIQSSTKGAQLARNAKLVKRKA